MAPSKTRVRRTETAQTRAVGADDEAWTAFERLSGGAPRAGMLRLGQAAGRPWSFAGFGTGVAFPVRAAGVAGRTPTSAETVVLRVQSLAPARRIDGATGGLRPTPVTLVGATN